MTYCKEIPLFSKYSTTIRRRKILQEPHLCSQLCLRASPKGGWFLCSLLERCWVFSPTGGSPAPKGFCLALGRAGAQSMHVCHRYGCRSSFWHREGFSLSITFWIAPTGWPESPRNLKHVSLSRGQSSAGLLPLVFPEAMTVLMVYSCCFLTKKDYFFLVREILRRSLCIHCCIAEVTEKQ